MLSKKKKIEQNVIQYLYNIIYKYELIKKMVLGMVYQEYPSQCLTFGEYLTVKHICLYCRNYDTIATRTI